MVTTRPMIRLSGFSRKTSFEDTQTLSGGSVGCSLHCPSHPRGSTQQQQQPLLVKCDCDCEQQQQREANILFRQKLLQNQRQHQLQRNHHLLLLQLQSKQQNRNQQHHKGHLVTGPTSRPKPPPRLTPQNQQVFQQRGHPPPVYFSRQPPPHPPPPPAQFRPGPLKLSDNSESDRESLEHFHRHLQQLHKITCASLENAIYFGSSGSSSISSLNRKDIKSKKSSTNKGKGPKTKSFSFRDIRDIGKSKKNGSSPSIPPLTRHQNSQASPSSSSCSSSAASTQQTSSTSCSKGASSSSSSSAAAIKRRNTTRTAKDYIGVSGVKLLAKYWSKGNANTKSSTADSGNGESSGGGTSRSSDSGESQLSNYSDNGYATNKLLCNPNRTNNNNSPGGGGGLKSCCSSPNKQSNVALIKSPASPSPPKAKSVYPISQNNVSGDDGNTVTYKVRYDIPSSWETEQLLSFASSASVVSSDEQDQEDEYSHHHKQKQCNKHAVRTKNKAGGIGCSNISLKSSIEDITCNIPSKEDQDQVRHSSSCCSSNKNKSKDTASNNICTHCGRGDPSSVVADAGKQSKTSDIAIAASAKPKKTTNIFKSFTFIKSQSAKPKFIDKNNNFEKGNKKDKLKKKDHYDSSDDNLSSKRLLADVEPSACTSSLSATALLGKAAAASCCERTMVQHTKASSSTQLGRSKSQKCLDKPHLTCQINSKSSKVHNNSQNHKLVHTNSLLVIPSKNEFSPHSKCLILPTKQDGSGTHFRGSSSNLVQSQSSSIQNLHSVNPHPKVRFKDNHLHQQLHHQLHHRSEQCLHKSFQREEEKRRNFRIRATAGQNPTHQLPPSSSHSPPSTNTNMLPDERKEYKSLYDCRIPRPKIKGIVPTHSYGVGGSGPSSPVSRCSSGMCGGENIHNGNRIRRYNGDFADYNSLEFTEISLQDNDNEEEEDSETSGFESEQNNTTAATTISLIRHKKDDISNECEGDFKRKHQNQKRTVPLEMTPAGKYFTDFKTSMYHYQEQQQQQRLSIQKSPPTPSRGLSFKKPNLPTLLSRSGKKKGCDDSAIDFLKSLPIFRKLGDSVFAKLSDHISEVSYANGSYVFYQGEKGDFMYFLVIGSAKATFTSLEPGKSEEIFLKNLHPGDFFGEKIFQMRKHTYNVVGTSDIVCLQIDSVAFEQLCKFSSDFKTRVIERKINLPEDIAKIKLDDLHIITTLGVGGFGRVELCTLRQDCSRAFALKKMKKCQIKNTRQIQHLKNEKQILFFCNSDFICKLHNTFRDDKYLFMLFEYLPGGELWSILRDNRTFPDRTAKFYIGCVIEALRYLHTKNIVYRDLKPENLLLDSSGYVKLVDFGFAKKLDGRKTWTFCGTPEYCAPEIILNKGHDLTADFWSLGVLMYELLTGTPPFAGGDPLRTYKIILNGIDAIDFPPIIGKYASNLIRKLCRDNPAERLGAQRGRISDIKKHKWFDDFNWTELQKRTMVPPIKPHVRGPLDFQNFDEYPLDNGCPPPDDLSEVFWDF